MARTFDIVDDDTKLLVEQVRNQYHPELAKARLKLDLLFVMSDNVDVAPIMLHGAKCAAVVKIINLEDRIKGNGDAQIKIDKEYWDGLTDRQQRALIDHELHHLIVDTNDSGNVKLDDAGRPKLKMRPHDVQIAWFTLIANRWGEDSQEQIQARDIWDEHGNAFFPFINDFSPSHAKAFDATPNAA